MSADELQRVQRAAAKHAAARASLETAMREANIAGASIRKIAKASGFSHERARQLIAATTTPKGHE